MCSRYTPIAWGLACRVNSTVLNNHLPGAWAAAAVTGERRDPAALSRKHSSSCRHVLNVR